VDDRDVVTRQATLIPHAAIEINRAKEFLKRRRLQNDLAFAIRNYASAVENDPVIPTNQVHEDDGNVCHLCAV
jgi:hypothetical protein